MPKPTVSDVHVNRPLTNISIAFMQDTRNFIADKVFPTVPVQKQSDAYFTYDRAYWNRDEMQDRAPATESAGNGYKIDADNTYYCAIKAFHKDIDDPTRANADATLDLDRDATEYVSRKALIKKEKLFVAGYMASAKWTYDYDGVASSPAANQVLQWNDASSTPIEDVWNAKEYILQLTGFEPNKLVLGYPVYKTLCNHPDFVDRVKYGQTPGKPAMVETSDMAQLFKVEEVLVSRGIETTSVEGAATTTSAFINGKVAGLFYAPPSPSLLVPSAGYIFSWTGYLGAGPGGQRIKRFRMEQLSADRVEIEIAFHMKQIAADLGAFWDAVVA